MITPLITSPAQAGAQLGKLRKWGAAPTNCCHRNWAPAYAGVAS